jgi:hypothetical protein
LISAFLKFKQGVGTKQILLKRLQPALAKLSGFIHARNAADLSNNLQGGIPSTAKALVGHKCPV